jgi:cysteine desulfurase
LQNIADLIGADPKDIVFTSGATESNNMSIKGVARFHKEKRRHVITTQTVSWGVTLPLLDLNYDLPK